MRRIATLAKTVKLTPKVKPSPRPIKGTISKRKEITD
jgi:hypothetical protein